MKFTHEGVAIEFTVPASYPYPKVLKKAQVIDRTASGLQQVETFRVDTNSFTVNFRDMPDADLSLLLDWYDNEVDGMAETFNIEDDLGDVYNNVRFVSSEIKHTLNAFELWDVSFDLEVTKNA